SQLARLCTRGLRLRPLRTVLGPTLAAVRDTCRIQRPAHHVITHARQILHAAATHEHQRVLLQVVADAGDVGGHLDLIGQPHTRHLAERRVRLLGRLREHTHTHTTLLRALLQRGALRLEVDLLSTLAYELADGRHSVSTCTRRTPSRPTRLWGRRTALPHLTPPQPPRGAHGGPGLKTACAVWHPN